MNELQPTAEELRVIIVVYASSLVPLALVLWLRFRGRLSKWIWRTYWLSFAACALGWELWFTYGWVDGDPVNERRAAVLTDAIPMHLNWLLNSLADAGAVCLGGLLLVWFVFRTKDHGQSGRPGEFFRSWHWGAFVVLLIHFIAQNLIVEMFLYHDQLAEGKPLSWAPLAPTGPGFNPTLFRFGERTITLQGQMPWFIMAPLFYAAVIWQARRDDAVLTS
jgi:hypothetical protein